MAAFDQSVVALADQITAALSQTPGDTASIRAVRKHFSKQFTELDRATVLEVAYELIDRAAVPKFVAYELVLHHAPAMQAITAAEVEALGQGMNSWADVDSFGTLVAGPAWRNGRVRDEVIGRWAKSEDRWWRRAALVSTVPLHAAAKADNGAAEKTLVMCRLLLQDRDDMVVKALSWALRAMAKREPKLVKAFIAENRGDLAARVVREVRNKLSTGLKNPKRRDRGDPQID